MPEADEEDWVEIRRFTDRIGAEMIRDFLADHDVRVAIHGNPQATRMTWSQTSDILRIVVAREDLESANEVLAAMTAGEQHPFRGPIPDRASVEEELDEPAPASRFEKPKGRLSAAVLALVLPIGAGHFYAQHAAAAKVLCVGMLASFLLAMVGHQPAFFRVWALLVLVDAVGAFFAARRYNERRVPSDRTQQLAAFGAVVAAFAVAWLLPF
ncbi:MAG: hypothetical protein JWP97_2984 [Labilithrix sp.]|nr:hypothetical protein [Labilithrix sp.]